MDNSGSSSAISGGAKIVIGIIIGVVVVGGATVLFSGSNKGAADLAPAEENTVEKTTTASNANETAAKSAEDTKTTAKADPYAALSSAKKPTEILATGKSTVCTSKVIPNVDSSIKYQFSDGNSRIDSSSMGVETHVIVLKSGKSYSWGNMYQGVMTGGQYDTSAKLLLQMPLYNYTCVEQVVSASVFVPPSK